MNSPDCGTQGSALEGRTNCGADTGVAPQAPGSVIRLRGLKIQTEDWGSVWATYKRHDIDCTRHWRKEGVWDYVVRNRAGEVVATGRWEGPGRLEMIRAAIRAAELDSPNTRLSNNENRDSSV